jgi:hypothetical protein
MKRKMVPIEASFTRFKGGVMNQKILFKQLENRMIDKREYVLIIGDQIDNSPYVDIIRQVTLNTLG